MQPLFTTLASLSMKAACKAQVSEQDPGWKVKSKWLRITSERQQQQAAGVR